MSADKLPDLFVIGAQKAGTTSLYYWLAQHPRIHGLQSTKEYPFFADDRLYSGGIENYARQFSGAAEQAVLMTGSVQFLFFPQALQRIRLHCPDARLLVLVRDPVARAVSAYRYALQRGLESRSFDAAIKAELSSENRLDAYSTRLDRFQKFYAARGLYGEQLQRLYQSFPADQVFVGVFEDMIADPACFLNSLLAFLGLEPAPIELNQANRTEGRPRSQLVSRIFYNRRLRDSVFVGALKKALSHHVRYRLRRLIVSMNTNKQQRTECQVSESTRQALRALYWQDLQQWGTPQAQAWLTTWGLHPSGNEGLSLG